MLNRIGEPISLWVLVEMLKCKLISHQVFREAEAKRLEEVGSRIRSQRREAEERKKEREVKFTDRMPPQKRSRGGCKLCPFLVLLTLLTNWLGNMPAQPKSLFQKTRSEASKLQKNIYNSRMIPPMPKGKDYRTTGPITLSTPQESYSNRVSVNTVIRRPLDSTTASSSGSRATFNAIPPQTNLLSPPKPTISPFPKLSSLNNDIQLTLRKDIPPSNSGILSSSPIDQSLSRPPSAAVKKDLMASLFVPKHRAYSQRMR